MKLLIILALVLSACAKSDPAAVPSTPKTVAAAWASPGAPNWTIDLSSFSSSAPFSMTESYLAGGSCQSAAIATAVDAENGTIVVSGSVATTTANGMAPCSQFDGTWIYSLVGQTLKIQIESNPFVELH